MVALMADKQKALPRTSGIVKKSTSTPKVRPVTDGEADDMSAADKKRNKLGYHRTAVACGKLTRSRTIWDRMLMSQRSLSSSENQMHSVSRPNCDKLSELYTTEKRLSVLSG